MRRSTSPSGDWRQVKKNIGQLFADVGGTITSIVHHYSHFNWVFSADVVVCEGTSHGEHRDGPWRAGVPEWGAGRWCDVFEIRDWKIQRCFIYLDPDYASKDTQRYPWLPQSNVEVTGPGAWQGLSMADADDVRRLALALPRRGGDRQRRLRLPGRRQGFVWSYPERRPGKPRVIRTDIAVLFVGDEAEKQALLLGEPGTSSPRPATTAGRW